MNETAATIAATVLGLLALFPALAFVLVVWQGKC